MVKVWISKFIQTYAKDIFSFMWLTKLTQTFKIKNNEEFGNTFIPFYWHTCFNCWIKIRSKISRRKCSLLNIQVANDGFLYCRDHSLQSLSTFFHKPFLSRITLPIVEVHFVSMRQRWETGSPACTLMVRGIKTTFPCLSINCNAFRNWLWLEYLKCITN